MKTYEQHVPSRRDRRMGKVLRGEWGTRTLRRDEDHGTSLRGMVGSINPKTGVFEKKLCPICQHPMVYGHGGAEECRTCGNGITFTA